MRVGSGLLVAGMSARNDEIWRDCSAPISSERSAYALVACMWEECAKGIPESAIPPFNRILPLRGSSSASLRNYIRYATKQA